MIIFVLAAAFAAIDASSLTCIREMGNYCQKESSTDKNEKLYQIANNEELNIWCQKQNKLMVCFERGIDKCITDGDKYKFLIESSRNFWSQFCNETNTLRKEFLDNVACYKPLAPKLDECSAEFKDSIRSMKSKNEDDAFQKACCFRSERQRCSTKAVEEHCGKKAADVMVTLFQEEMGTELSSRCKNYHQLQDCSEIGKEGDFVDYVYDYPNGASRLIQVERTFFYGLLLSIVALVQFSR